MAQLVAVARHEHLAMTSERAFDAAAARAAAPMDRALLDRGIRMRVLGLQPVYEDPLLPYRSRPAEPTPDYRQAAAVPMKLIVVDRRVALLPAVPDDLDRGYLEVVREPVVSGLLALFERHWDAAPPAAPAPCGVVLSSREHALLGLLAAGLTDAAAARRLRISPRSVTTAMRGLMDRLGAQNRFQLGLALGVARVVTAPGAAGRGEKT
jgi:DNA-binding CsgD family transcriptional regulator